MITGWKKRMMAIVLCVAVAISTNGIVMAAEPSSVMQDETSRNGESDSAETELQTEMTESIQESEKSSQPQTELETELQSDVQTEKTTEMPETEAVTEVVSEDNIQTETESEVQTDTVETNQHVYTYTDPEMSVKVTFAGENTLPEGTVLQVKKIQDLKIGREQTQDVVQEQAVYDQVQTLMQQRGQEEGNPIDGFFAYDIQFEKEGQSYELKKDMKVEIQFTSPLISDNFKDSNLRMKEVRLFQLISDEAKGGERIAVDKKNAVQECVQEGTGNGVKSIGFLTDNLTECVIAFNGTDTTKEFSYTDGMVNVTATLSKEGILPRGAELKVDALTSKKDLEAVQEEITALQEEDTDIEGNFLAYDIRFEKDGIEVEPDGDVTVHMDFVQAVKPQEVNAENVRSNGEDITLYHLKESEGQVNVERLSDAQVNTTAQSEVKNVEFSVGSFSKFFLYWGMFPWGGNHRLLYVDEDLNEIEASLGEETNAVASGVVNVKDYAKEIEGYELLKIVPYINPNIEGSIKQIKCVARELSYNTDLSDQWVKLGMVKTDPTNVPCDADLYIVYRKKQVEDSNPKKTISTLSIPDLSMKMYRYPGGNNVSLGNNIIGGNYITNGSSTGGVRLGMVSNQLEANGFPVSNITGKSLSYMYGDQKPSGTGVYDVDNLFYRDGEGYYYYSSAENFAHLNTNIINELGKNVFQVYNWTGGWNYSSSTPSFSQGNFFPFNDLYKENGIFPGSPNIHRIPANERVNNFGMTMEFGFTQPKGGQYNGKDMIFEFKGDDDVFVYIDGKLVLDIGGSHEAIGGSINFATGEVVVEQVAQLENGTMNGNKPVKTNLKEKLGGLLEDNTYHELKLFYAERGGASNFKMRFNLDPIPKESLVIGKQLSNTDKEQYANVKFGFKLYTRSKNSQDTEMKQVTSYPEAYLQKEGKANVKLQFDENGIFYLKAGEKAIFKEMDSTNLYRVEEVNVQSDEFDQVIVNGTTATVGDGVAASNEMEVGKYPQITFTNHCSVKNNRMLSIKKEMKAGDTVGEEEQFKLQVKLESTDGELILYNGPYAVYDSNMQLIQKAAVANQGIVLLKAGQTAVLSKILSGTEFEVTEPELDVKYQAPQYSVKNADKMNSNGKAYGEVVLSKDVQVVVKNSLKRVPLTIKKTVDQHQSIHGDPIFTFRITNLDTNEVFYRNIRFTGDSDKEVTKSVKIENLPFGNYRVEELDTLRYECAGETQKDVVLGENGGEAAFKNLKKVKNYYSDTDIVVNQFTMDENGKIVITPTRVDSN